VRNNSQRPNTVCRRNQPFRYDKKRVFATANPTLLATLALCAILSNLVSCSTTRHPAIQQVQSVEELVFYDTDEFDQQLASLMQKGHRSIELGFYGDISINHIPKRLQRWLARVNRYGGGYRIEILDDTEFFPKNAGVALSLLIRALPFVTDNYRNSLASKYSAVIELQAASGHIKMIQFDHAPTSTDTEPLINKSRDLLQ